MSGNATNEFDALGAEAVFGDGGARILRVIPVQDSNGVKHEYFDRRDVGWLMRCDQEQWLVVNFWTQIAIVAVMSLAWQLYSAEMPYAYPEDFARRFTDEWEFRSTEWSG